MKPNILVFMTDHQRWDTVYPFCRAKMPALEKLAKESTVFTHAYTTAPHCCPARASFFSGLFPTEHGVWNNVDVGNSLSRRLYPGVRLFSEFMPDYERKFCGKWHVSSIDGPDQYGFTDCFTDKLRFEKAPEAPVTYEWENQYRHEQICTENTPRGEGQIVRPGYPMYTQYGNSDSPFGDVVKTDKAVEMLREYDGKKPLLLYVGLLSPHDPYRPPLEDEALYELPELPENFNDPMTDKPNLYRRTKSMYDQLSQQEHRESMRKYLANCTFIDRQFARVMAEAEKLPGRTIVIFLADHGDYLAEHGLWAKGLPCFDGAYHIPLVIFDSASRQGRVVEDFVSITDLAPTILELANEPCNLSFSGRSLIPYLNGETIEEQDAVYTQSNGNELYGIQRSIREKRFKLVYNGFDFDEFYDLELDPGELQNRINDPQYQPQIKRLYRKLWEFAYAHQDSSVNPYIMVGLAGVGPGVIFQKDE